MCTYIAKRNPKSLVIGIELAFIFYALTDTINEEIKVKIESKMKKTAKLVSYIFKIKEWDEEVLEYKEEPEFSSINVYKRP